MIRKTPNNLDVKKYEQIMKGNYTACPFSVDLHFKKNDE